MTSQQPREATPIGERPLVSLFMFVRNGAASIRRAVESVRAQTYPNIEFIVQDGASTDETLAILRSYDMDIKLVSEPDSGPSDGLWRAINRCSGEIIGSCLADEELLPTSVERAVSILKANPDAGALTGDAILTDLSGSRTGFWKSGPFNFIDYLLCDYTPYFVSSFFRTRSLVDAGLKSEKWGTDCIEFELWCRLASQARIVYVPETFAKYASHPGQSSSNPNDAEIHFRGRLNLIAELCERPGLVGRDPLLRSLFIWGHARAFINHAQSVGRSELARTLYRITIEILSRYPTVELDGLPYDASDTYRRAAQVAWRDLVCRIPKPIRTLVGATRLTDWERRFQAALTAAGFELQHEHPSALEALLTVAGYRKAVPVEERLPFPPAPSPTLKAKMYARLAEGYEAEGRYREAAETWHGAGRLIGLVPPQPSSERIGYTAG